MRTQRISASATAQGRLSALARIVAGGSTYLARAWRTRRQGCRVAIVTHIVLGAVLAAGGTLGLPVRFVLLGIIAGARRPGLIAALRERIYRFTVRRAELVLCYSRRECDLYAQRFRQDRAKFHTVPCSVNISPQWRGDRKLGLPRPYVAAAGRTNRDYPTLVRACRDLPCQVIVATDRAFPGPVPHNMILRDDLFWGDYLQLLADSAFVVVPLLRHDESSGQMVMLEAMLLGKAVIATRTTTTVDYGTHDKTCLFVPPADDGALRGAMQRLIDDPHLARCIGQAGQQYATQRHSAEALARAVLETVTCHLDQPKTKQAEPVPDDHHLVQPHPGS